MIIGRSSIRPVHALTLALAALSLAVLPVLAGPAAPAAPARDAAALARTAAGVTAVASIGLTVADLDRSVAFFTDVLAFDVIEETEAAGNDTERLTGVFGARCRTATLRLGGETIELTQYLAPESRPFPVPTRSNDRWFQHIAIVVSDMDAAYAHLRSRNVRHASPSPQTLPPGTPAAGVSAFYFRDPDGHFLEVIHFPPGVGDPRWQAAAADGRLFLGIDHTAIVVADTDRSLRLYRDALGMTVAGSFENSGTEQEHLNNVFGARLRITTLRAPQGPGVELLEYLAPGDGRDAPADSRPCDLWHWHTTVTAPDPAATLAAFRAAGAAIASFPAPGGSAAAASFMARDPDGHALRVRPARP